MEEVSEDGYRYMVQASAIGKRERRKEAKKKCILSASLVQSNYHLNNIYNCINHHSQPAGQLLSIVGYTLGS
jgi:hypothetical protein